MDVAYSSRLILRNNQFGTTSNAITLLPNVFSSGQSIVLQSKDKIMSVVKVSAACNILLLRSLIGCTAYHVPTAINIQIMIIT